MPDDSETCSHCGAVLRSPDTTEPTPPVAATPPVPATPRPPEPIVVPPLPPTAAPTPGRVVSVNRTVTAQVHLSFPQEAVDKQRWLTEEQWRRLMEAYEEQLAARMNADLQSGQAVDLATESGGVHVAWEQVGDRLDPAQRVEIEQGLQQLLSGTPTIPPTPGVAVPPVVVRTPVRVRTSIGCSLPWVALAVTLAGAVLCAVAH